MVSAAGQAQMGVCLCKHQVAQKLQIQGFSCLSYLLNRGPVGLLPQRNQEGAHGRRYRLLLCIKSFDPVAQSAFAYPKFPAELFARLSPFELAHHLLPNLLGVGASWGHDRSYYRMASPAPRALTPDYPRLNPHAPAPNLAAIAAPEIQLCPANRAFYQSFPNSPSYFFHYPSIIALEIFAAIYYDQDVSWG